MKTFWTTFYSYKGGVGRSLALANIAALLVRKGRRVLLIDFDLEAPGLDSFCEFASLKSKPGVIEYTADFLDHKRAPDIRNFVHECPFPEGLRGKLWIMPAGRKDSSYNQQLHKINWIQLYDEGLGRPFVDNWKAAIEDAFKPDFVLIDSRTGITEIGGICTTQFPDLVVMLFGLNDQNVRGIHSVARAIVEAKGDRAPQITYVATPIPSLLTDEQGLLKKRLDIATNVLGTKIEYSIRYYPQAALEEKLFVLAPVFPQPPIIQDYETLCKRIVDLNRLGLDFLIRESEKVIKDGDGDRIPALLALFAKDYANEPEAIFTQAELLKELGRTDESIALTESAFLKDPSYLPAFQVLERHYKRKKEPKKIADLCGLVLSKSDLLEPGQIYDLTLARGGYLMEAEDYRAANESYQQARDVFERTGLPPRVKLPAIFNVAESRRRFTRNVLSLEWATVIAFFETADVASQPPDILACQNQAMHIAYAVTGNINKAFECLHRAGALASALSDASVVFSPKFYRYVVKPDFITANNEMIKALQQGVLWDGTPVSNKLPGNPLLV